MKKMLLFTTIILLNISCLSQVKNDLSYKDTLFLKYQDFYFTTDNGEMIYCGIDESISKNTFTTYYIQSADSTLLSCKILSTIDSSYTIGYYRRHEKLFYENKKRQCWDKDLIWLTFDKNHKLIQTLFFNVGVMVLPNEMYMQYK